VTLVCSVYGNNVASVTNILKVYLNLKMSLLFLHSGISNVLDCFRALNHSPYTPHIIHITHNTNTIHTIHTTHTTHTTYTTLHTLHTLPTLHTPHTHTNTYVQFSYCTSSSLPNMQKMPQDRTKSPNSINPSRSKASEVRNTCVSVLFV